MRFKKCKYEGFSVIDSNFSIGYLKVMVLECVLLSFEIRFGTINSWDSLVVIVSTCLNCTNVIK